MCGNFDVGRIRKLDSSGHIQYGLDLVVGRSHDLSELVYDLKVLTRFRSGGRIRSRAPTSMLHDVGQFEEFLRMGLKDELLAQHRVLIRDELDRVSTETPKDTALAVHLENVVGAFPRHTETTIPHLYVEVTPSVKLLKLLGREGASEELDRSLFGSLPFCFGFLAVSFVLEPGGSFPDGLTPR